MRLDLCRGVLGTARVAGHHLIAAAIAEDFRATADLIVLLQLGRALEVTLAILLLVPGELIDADQLDLRQWPTVGANLLHRIALLLFLLSVALLRV